MKEAQKRSKAMRSRVSWKRSLALIMGIGVLLTATTFGYGQSDSSEDQVHARKLAFVFRMGVATIPNGDYGSDFAYGGGLLHQFSDRLALEFILERYIIPVSGDLGGLGSGNLQTTPLLFSLQYRFPTGRFVPYAAIGAGFYFFHYDPDNLPEDKVQQIDVVDRFAMHLGGGADYKLLRSFDLFVDLRLSLVKTWVQHSLEHDVLPEERDKFHLNALTLYIGFRYYF